MFITFEGIEGSGKTTLLAALAQELKKQNKKVVCTAEPGGSSIGPELRQLLLTKKDINPMSELLLFLAERVQHAHQVIIPALESGAIVLCDRFTDSTVVYQGYGRGLDIFQIYQLSDETVSLKPDLTFLLNVPVSVARKRVAKRKNSERNRFDDASTEFYKIIRRGYLRMAQIFQDRIKVLDAKKPPEALTRECLGYIRDFESDSGQKPGRRLPKSEPFKNDSAASLSRNRKPSEDNFQ